MAEYPEYLDWPSPPPPPPQPFQPQLVPGPRGFERAWEIGLAPLSEMPWIPMKGRGANFVQGFIRGSANAARARGEGRAKTNEARTRQAADINEQRERAYVDLNRRWQDDVSELGKERRRARAEAEKEKAKLWKFENLPAPLRLLLRDLPDKSDRPLSEWGDLGRMSKPEKERDTEQVPTLAQRAAAAAAPMETRASLWDAKGRETVENPAGPVFPRVPAFPGAADSAFKYREQADKNRAAVMGLLPQGQPAPAPEQEPRPSSTAVVYYSTRIKSAQTKAQLTEAGKAIKTDARLTQAEINELGRMVDEVAAKKGWAK